MTRYPNLRHVRTFVEVIGLRSFAAAAVRLHMSPSAVSQAVAGLERQVGVRLVDRTAREIAPTPAGAELLPGFVRLLEDAELTMRHGAEWGHLRRGSLRLLAIPSVAYRMLPAIVRRFDARHPTVGVTVGDDKDLPLRQRLRAGEGDLAMLTCDSTEPDLRSMPIMRDNFRVLMPRRHPLAGRESVREADLLGVTLILLKQGMMLRAYVDGVVTRLPLSQRRIEVEQTQTLVGMVEAGLGVALLSGLACPSVAMRSVLTRPFAVRPAISRLVGFARPVDRAPSPVVEAFVRTALAYFGSGEYQPPEGVELMPTAESDLIRFLR